MRPKLCDAETSTSQASWVRIQLVSPGGHQVFFFFLKFLLCTFSNINYN